MTDGGGGQTAGSPSGWTVDTLKVLHDEKLVSVERIAAAESHRLADRIESLESLLQNLARERGMAQDKFEASVASRFVQVNEFRGALDDLGQQMSTRRELEAAVAAQQSLLRELSGQLGDLRSRIDVGPAALAGLQTRADVQSGRQQGVQLSTGLLFGGLAAFAAFVSIVVIVGTYLSNH